MRHYTSKASITGMREGYSEYALSQYNAVAKGLDRATKQLIETLELNSPNDSLVQIVDLGAADGVNSFPVIDRFARSLLKKRSPLNLSVTHVDLPSADFNGLSRNIHESELGYRNTLAEEKLILHSTMVPGSFYESFISAGSADIIISTTALHYASRCASTLSKHIHPVFASGLEEKSAWSELDERDLNAALSNIHSGLKRGGKFWAVVPAYGLDESSGEIKNYWYREVLNMMTEQLRSLVEKGTLGEDKWNNFVLPVHQRHLNQWKSWFTEHESMFQLKFLYDEEQSNPYLDRYRHEHHDVTRFADEYLSSIRAWSEQIVISLLPDRQQRDLFFQGLRNRFLEEPDRFENDTFSVYIGATRL